jgi:hypothetical protein
LLLRRGAIPPSKHLWKLNPASKEYRVIKKIQRAWDTLEKKRPREIQKTEKLFRDKTGLPEDIIQMILRDTGS